MDVRAEPRAAEPRAAEPRAGEPRAGEPRAGEPGRTTPRRSALYGTLVAHAVSVSGTRISSIALPWFVLTTTGSATRTGLVVLFEMLPLVVAKALGGPLIDRIGPRRVSIAADAASALAVAAIPVLHLMGGLRFPVLLGLVAVAGALRGPGDNAKDTIVPDIADAAGVSVERVTGLAGSTDRIAMIIGPSLAGVLISWVGAVNAIAVDAASFAVCALVIAVFAPSRHAPQPASPATSRTTAATPATAESPGSYLRELRSGWDYLAGQRLMRSITVMVACSNLLDAAYFSVLLPLWIRDHGYGPTQIGLLGTAFGVTATIASLLAAAYGHRLNRRLTFVAGFLLAGAPRFVALALSAPLWSIVAVGVVGGFGSGFLNPIISAVYVQRTPRALLGRVMAMADALAWSGIPFGGILAGAGVLAIGLSPVLFVAGGAYLLVTSVPAMLGQWRDLDD